MVKGFRDRQQFRYVFKLAVSIDPDLSNTEVFNILPISNNVIVKSPVRFKSKYLWRTFEKFLLFYHRFILDATIFFNDIILAITGPKLSTYDVKSIRGLREWNNDT